jgi:hypothetical protein
MKLKKKQLKKTWKNNPSQVELTQQNHDSSFKTRMTS